MSQDIFYVDVWGVKLHQALAPVDILQALLTDADVGALLRPRLKGVSYLSQGDDTMDDTYLRGETDIALQVYMNQMLVLAITYGEQIIRDFYRCLFRAHPQRMNPVLSPEGRGKATVDLNTIIGKPSRKALLRGLADEAAQRLAGRRIDDSVARIIKDSRVAAKAPFVGDLKKLVDRRNRVVHEGENSDLTWGQIHGAFGQILYLLYLLGEAALSYNLPISDDTNFIHNFRRKLEPDS